MRGAGPGPGPRPAGGGDDLAEHHLDQSLGGNGQPGLAHHRAEPHHRDPVAELFDLLQLVADEDHGDALVTRQSSIRIGGRATDHSRVHDLYLFVDANKVFYQNQLLDWFDRFVLGGSPENGSDD